MSWLQEIAKTLVTFRGREFDSTRGQLKNISVREFSPTETSIIRYEYGFPQGLT